MTVAIGARLNDGNGPYSGHVRVYSWDGNSWNQLGADIDGEAASDGSGYSVSLSSDGMTVAIGAIGNDGNGSNAGHVRIYSWDGNSWNQLGADIDGEAASDQSGTSVSLSSDGMTVAIGAEFNDENGPYSGHVRVYSWDGNSWNQLGVDIDAEAAYDDSGNSVSLSSDGMTVAVAARSNVGNGSYSGHVRVYSWDGISWNQLGADIDGEAAFDYSGTSVSLSSDGMTVAIGAIGNDGNGPWSGHVRIYSWDGNSWNQLGNDIDGEAAGDESGYSVSLSSNGLTVAVGAPYNYGNGYNSGHVRIYSWDGNSWNQLGADIDGEAANNKSGNSVSLSSDGLTVAIGARYNDGNGSWSGHVRIYSLESLDLIINNSNTGVDAQEHCDTYTWIDGNTYTSSNNSATWTLTNAAGCDSVVTLDLTINNSNTGVDTQVHCDTYTWIDGNTYTSSNNSATWTLTNAAGCDSVVTLDLTINNSNTGVDTQVHCDTYTWIDGNTYTSSNSSATWTLTNAAGCDSVVTLDLTINNNTGVDTQEHCDSYTWIDGNTYTSSNNSATWTLTNAAGCDSVVTLDLTINNSNTGVDTQVHCDTYTWIDGNTYTSSNNSATWTLTNAAGCDSVVTLDLTINNSNTGVDTQVHCDTYTWIDGNTYTSSNNTATWTLTNAAGCDSVVTLDLTINNSNTGVDTQVHCDTYTWIDGNTYTSSNSSATWTLTNAAGCDSVVILDLTIKPSPEQLIINQYWSTTFNTGESFAYQWYLNGEALENDTTELLNFIQGGSYTVEAINSFGCKTMSESLYRKIKKENFDEIDFMVYPNPTKNLVFIELMEELGTEGDIIVSDLVGQTLKTIELKESNSSLIDFSIFKNGPYIITIKYPNGLQLSKTIIKVLIMKKLLFIIILIPFIGMAQITDNLFVEFNRVFVDDLKYTDKDINLFSPDMSSSHNSKSDIEMGVSMSLGYNFSDKLSFWSIVYYCRDFRFQRY